MSYIRRLPSGKWQATVRGPDGRKHTKTRPAQVVVRTWASEQEAQFQQGDIRDPRAGDIRVGDWHARYAAASGVEEITAAKNASLWGALRAEVGDLAHVRGHPDGGSGLGWRAGDDAAGPAPAAGRRTATRRAAAVGRHDRRHRAPHVGAVPGGDAEHPPVVLINPFADLDLPGIEPRPVEFYEPDEAARLYAAAGRSAPSGGRWSSWACRSACARASCTGCMATGWTGCAAGSRLSTS